MKKTRLMLIILIACISLAGASDLILIKVKAQLANVRSEPRLSAAVVTQLKGGTTLESSGRKGDFYEIAVVDEAGRATTGYIFADTVEVVSSEAEARPPAEPSALAPPPAPERPAAKEAAAEAATRPNPAYEPPRTGLGLTAGYALPSGYGSGVALGGSFRFGFSANFGVEISALYFQSAVDEPEAEDRESGLSQGKLTVIPVELSLVGRFPVSSKLTPYILAGGGYFLNTFKIDGAVKSGWEGLGFAIEEKLDNSFGFHVGAGLDFFLAPKLAAGLTVRYSLSKAKGSWSLREAATDIEAKGNLSGLDLKPLVFGLGLRYFF
ncbi:MAG: outer membrane beta-barrel protein [Candidatus Aminicenantes bacterium]|nr:outer membrane beta-barrel protein [Candidatus Aminicenantes bacterium]